MSMSFTTFINTNELIKFLSAIKHFLKIKTFYINRQINVITYNDTFQCFLVGLDDY